MGGIFLLFVNRRRKFKNSNSRVYIIGLLLAILLLLILINRIFLISSQVYDIEDISSEALEFYFSLEHSYNIEWYYFAAINDMDGNLENHINNSNIKKFISFYKSNNYEIESALISLRGVDFKDELIKNTNKFVAIDKVLRNKEFPIPDNISYEYDNGWGAERTYGGERTHEGIDIITEKGVPIVSVGNGKIKNIGWNELGGWRIGITGDDDIYYYYAHLDSYEKIFQIGEKIKKGDILGYVGNTGYGPEGTSGKFVDHLHFGMYEKNTAINPYPFLKGWELNN
jgi:murein DD-endopeptidase MepM/ murein hydrolase activator NlpD